jgi:hypothetical protein
MALIPFTPRNIQIGLRNGIKDRTTQAALDFLTIVVPATPRKTGLAQGNWRVSGKAFPVGVVKRTGAGITLAQAARTLDGIARKTRSGKVPKIFIANNVPYINLLNSGSSVQAPAGFVEASLVAAGVKFDRGSDDLAEFV